MPASPGRSRSKAGEVMAPPSPELRARKPGAARAAMRGVTACSRGGARFRRRPRCARKRRRWSRTCAAGFSAVRQVGIKPQLVGTLHRAPIPRPQRFGDGSGVRAGGTKDSVYNAVWTRNHSRPGMSQTIATCACSSSGLSVV